MKDAQIFKPNNLSILEEVAPGIKRISLNSEALYSSGNKGQLFKNRLCKLLAVGTCNKIINYHDGVVNYLTESVIPTKKDSRPPLLLLFGNPTPESILQGCFFSSEKGRREHRFWPILEKAGIISFNSLTEDANLSRTKYLFDLNYTSPFRIGLEVFYTIPTPASDKKWSGVAGLRKLFGTKAFRQLTSWEKERVNRGIRRFIGKNSHGAVIAFQKDAYVGVWDKASPEHIVATSSNGKWNLIESRTDTGVRLFKIPPTRYMNARWYENFLQYIAAHC